MTGYVVADKPEMKIREYELYKSYYCGVCRSVGKRFGQVQRMVLSYDFAFLALLLNSLTSDDEKIENGHCIIHPVKKINATVDNVMIDYAADMMMLLAYKNIEDDIKDEGKSWLKIPVFAFRRNYKNLAIQYPGIAGIVEEEIKTLSKFEYECCDSLDITSDASGRIMQAVLSGYPGFTDNSQPNECYEREHLSQNNQTQSETAKEARIVAVESEKKEKNNRLILSSFGFYLGKWIYIIDAFDDLEKDIAKGCYNPLFHRFGFSNKEESIEDFKKRIRPNIEALLYNYLGEMSKALNLADIQKNRGIIDNVFYFGMNRKTEQILAKK